MVWQKISVLEIMHVPMKMRLSLVSGFHEGPFNPNWPTTLLILSKSMGPTMEDLGKTREGGAALLHWATLEQQPVRGSLHSLHLPVLASRLAHSAAFLSLLSSHHGSTIQNHTLSPALPNQILGSFCSDFSEVSKGKHCS